MFFLWYRENLDLEAVVEKNEQLGINQKFGDHFDLPGMTLQSVTVMVEEIDVVLVHGTDQGQDHLYLITTTDVADLVLPKEGLDLEAGRHKLDQ
jgi:hypothetical protein